MLHIILTVLKITGILLLALILLVIGIIAAVLFVPLRYRITAVHTGDDTHGEARITWLLHLVSVHLVLRLPAEKDSGPPQSALRVSFRILGISPQKAAAFFRNRKNHSAKKKKTEPAKTGRVKEEGKPASANKEQTNAEKKSGAARKENVNAGKKPNSAQKENVNADKQPAKVRKESVSNEKKPDAVQKERVIKDKQPDAALNKIRSFCGTIRKIPKRLQRLKDSILKAAGKPGEFAKKLSDFRQKLERYDAAETVKEVWNQIRKLLRHFRVRKGKGYLRFGTGDPALTGELTGVLYLLLPVSCREISVEPQFTDTMLDMELTVAGHIRLIHLASAALWAVRNRRLRGLIRAFRRGS